MRSGRLYIATRWYTHAPENKSGREKAHKKADGAPRFIWLPRRPSGSRTRVADAARDFARTVLNMDPSEQRELHRLTFDVWDAPEVRRRVNDPADLPPDMNL